MQNNPIITKQTRLLSTELEKRGIKHKIEYSDGHKHIDIAILDARIFIEIDGLHHYTNSEQIKRDFKRNHFSDGDDFDTIHIPNELIENYLEKIADAITKVVKERQEK